MFQEAAPQRASVSNVSIDLYRVGKGRPLLYLHAGDGVDPTDEFISELAAVHEVIVPSHPGFGNSDLPREFGDVADLGYFYLDLLDQFDLSDCIVVGSSFGGWIAVEMAIRSTERIGALVLAAPMGVRQPGNDGEKITDLISVPIADLPGLLFHDREEGLRAFGNLDFPAMGEAATLRFARNREALTLYGWPRTFSNPKLLRWLHRIDVPTLLLWGEDDRVVPAGISALYERELRSVVRKTVAGAGHYVHRERPGEFARAILQFGKDGAGP